MTLIERIDSELKVALKARDDLRLAVLRMTKSELKYKQIELGRDLSDEEAIAVFSSAAKKRTEAMEQYRDAGREDLEKRESAEYEIICEFLPEQLSDDELNSLIDEAVAETEATSIKNLGNVMEVLMPQIRGRVDGKVANIAVRAKLLDE